MILLSPWWCLLILFALFPWVGPWRGRNLGQNILRSLLFVCLALALAQPRLAVDNQHVDRVLIIDRSASVTADAKASIAKQLSGFSESSKGSTRDHLVMIGAPLADADTSQFDSTSHVSVESVQGSSPLSAAITRAQLLIPSKCAGSLTIASDSLATRPDDDRAIAALRSRMIPIHWVELPTIERPPTPVQVHWPAPLRQGTSSRLIVKVVSGAAASGEVLLKHGEKTLASAPFNNSNQQPHVELTFEPKQAGFLNCEVVVSSGNESQSLPVVLPIENPHQLLYLGDLQKGGFEKLGQMLGASFEVIAGDVNDSVLLNEMLQTADLVMLDDMPAESLPKEAERQLVNAVQNDGLGVVMSGGRASFGAGGWHSRPMESLLPVELVQKEEKRDPSTSLVIVIDTSGSMSGVRVQLAKEVSRLAMKRLLPHDKVGIVEFFGAKRWAAPLQPASNAIELQRALNRMDAGGGTVILPALEEAFYGLQNVDTRYKHVLVLTDGGVEAGDFESLMRRMASEGINVSTVLAGGGYHSEFLVNIANWGKGRFYNVPNRFNLPEILLKQPSTTKLPAYRPGSHPVRARGGEGWWGDVNMSSPPNLAGYVESKPRPGSQVLLETVNGKHPILATWRYGLGRVTTLTTEPLGNGTEPWQQWAGYSKALSRILQRSAADAREPFQFNVENDGGKVIVHAIRQQSRKAMSTENRPVAKVAYSDETLNFVRRSPDRFVAFLPAPRRGEAVRIQTSSLVTPLRQQLLVVASSTVEERHVDPQNSIDLGNLADVAGGQRFDLASNWFDAPTSTPTGKAYWSPTPWLFGLSLLLFLAEIVWRRRPAPVASRVAAATAMVLFMCLASGQTSIAQDANAAKQSDADVLLPEELGQEVNSIIDQSLQTGVDRTQVAELFRSATLAGGSVEKLLQWLSESRDDVGQPRGQVMAEIEVHVASQRGELKRAAAVLADLLKVKTLRDKRSDLLIWHAKLYDALGEVDEARKLYEELAKQNLSDEDQKSVRLRLALMGLIGNRDSAGAEPLIEMAQKSEDLAFRNRAAIVLAVQNKPAEAVKLFTIQGKGTVRFRNASRMTEWAVRAKDREKAIESAWDAVNSAQLKRDRNYALSLLVESYRLNKNTEGLEELVKNLTDKNDANEAMADETRLVWISLLRELGRYDDAIALFKSTADDERGFTIEMRRELLELEGEAGNEDRMIQSYRDLIKSDPKEMTWRSGLTQILLEQGQDSDARALWRDFVNESTNGTTLLIAAQTLGEFGMDDLAQATVERMVQLESNQGQALLYWADLQQRRGNVDVAEQTLNRIQTMGNAADDILAELASAFERIGRQDKAIEVNEAIRASRDTVAEDLELRLAWLYSEIGDEDKAQEQWLALWRKVNSIPRRRYIEDRLMTVASRLGTLADIAIDLEEKLADGTADARDAGLLVRIYSRVNDSVAATEISEEYMAKSGKNQVEQLQEKGRIYQICNDYWNYEKVVEQLIEVDPAGKTEYLRQLALSMLERGKTQDARDVLMTLRNADDGKDSIGGEFEAGVLSLVGMKPEAANAYRKGIAAHPDRIESYLLLANLLKDMRQTERAIGMFQYLAENAERDDMFTIAIDGLLNMEAGKDIMQWARRITLERLAGREDKNYLYQLLSDLSSEVRDKSGQILALENSLAVSGTRRLSVLRECMELSTRIRDGAYSSRSAGGPTNKGNEPFFAFGRRLIGLGELLPPQVFLDLGQAFLDDGNIAGAERTFGMARNLADTRSYQREVAEIFEKGGKGPEALVRYDKLLRTSPSDAGLIARVAKLNEQEGKDEVASRFYQRGLELLFAQIPLTTQKESKQAKWNYARNVGSYEVYSPQMKQGLMVTLPDAQIDNLLTEQNQQLTEDLKELNLVRQQGRVVKNLKESPRIDKRTSIMRQFYLALDRIEDLEAMNAVLINQFPDDKRLLTEFAQELRIWGRYDSIERMLQAPNIAEGERKQLLSLLGQAEPKSRTSKLSPKEMWQGLLAAWMDGDDEAAKQTLRRVDQSQGLVLNPSSWYSSRNGLGNSNGSAKVNPWMRLAIAMGDEGLALQFARSRLKTYTNSYYAPTTESMFEGYENILPEKTFSDLVRFAANLYKDDPKRLESYLWIVSKHRDYLGNDALDDKELLKRITDGNLQISYRFPISKVMDVVPESIRGDVLKGILGSASRKLRLRDLLGIPFTVNVPIDAESAKMILDAIESGIDPAIEDNMLRYARVGLPQSGTVLGCSDNFQLGMSVLDVLISDKVRKSDSTVSEVAENLKAIMLYQSGKTDAAMELVSSSFEQNSKSMDYFIKSTRDWAYREIAPGAIDRFVGLVDKQIRDGKPTLTQTDQRLKYIKLADDKAALRSAYQLALEKHPNTQKYAVAYERWEQHQNRTFAVIDMYEKRLAAAKAAKDTRTSTMAQAKLAQLFLAVNHLPKALPHWLAKDDADKKMFKQMQERWAKSQKAEGNKKAINKKANADAIKARNAQQVANAARLGGGITYQGYIVGVKSAVEGGDFDAAKQIVRKMWRVLPSTTASRFKPNFPALNDLEWPNEILDPSNLKSVEATQAVAEQARIVTRGGLAAFIPKVPVTPKKSASVWQKLAEYPFAVEEMKRIIRYQSTPKITLVQDVSMGLLQVVRNRDGDKAAFDSLVQQIRSGNLSEKVLLRFFAMLKDGQSLVDADSKSVIDVFLRRLDLTNVSRATQLAGLCAETGQHKRAAVLYRHCALLTSDSPGSFAGLLTQAKKVYSGVDLMTLAESMFELTGQNPESVSQLLELRMEILAPKAAADRSRSLFDGEVAATSGAEFSQLVRAVPVFARNGDHELAAKCLASVLAGNPKDAVAASPYSRSSPTNSNKAVIRVSRDDLIRMFPADMSQYQDKDEWLTTAVATVAKCKKDEGTKSNVIVETLLTIAMRQCENDDTEAAVETLKSIEDEWLADATQHEMLAIDIMRLAGQEQQAFDLATKVHAQGRLTHLRFGDLLRDTNEMDGPAAAAKLLSELTELSMDKDLLAAAGEVAGDDKALLKQVKQLEDAQEEAKKVYKDRRAAAKKRVETQRQWRLEGNRKMGAAKASR